MHRGGNTGLDQDRQVFLNIAKSILPVNKKFATAGRDEVCLDFFRSGAYFSMPREDKNHLKFTTLFFTPKSPLFAEPRHGPVFGIIKSVMGFRQFLLRGNEAVGGEWLPVCVAFNIKGMHVLRATGQITGRT